MSGLVPEEAVGAAIQRASELFIHGGYTEYERIEQALESAAPYIAAKALRDAAHTAPFAHRGYVENVNGDLPEVVLRRLADELEAGEQG